MQAACLVCLAHGANDVANSISPLIVELGIKQKPLNWAYIEGGVGIALGLLTLGFLVIETVGKNIIKLDFYKAFACQFATANSVILGTRLGIPLSTTHCMIGSLFGIVLCNKIELVKYTYKQLTEVDIYVKDNAIPKIETGEDEDVDEIENMYMNSYHSEAISRRMQKSLSRLFGESEPVNLAKSAPDVVSKSLNSENMEPIVEEQAEGEKNESSLNLATVKKILFFWALTVPVAAGTAYVITLLLLL